MSLRGQDHIADSQAKKKKLSFRQLQSLNASTNDAVAKAQARARQAELAKGSALSVPLIAADGSTRTAGGAKTTEAVGKATSEHPGASGSLPSSPPRQSPEGMRKRARSPDSSEHVPLAKRASGQSARMNLATAKSADEVDALADRLSNVSLIRGLHLPARKGYKVRFGRAVLRRAADFDEMAELRKENPSFEMLGDRFGLLISEMTTLGLYMAKEGDELAAKARDKAEAFSAKEKELAAAKRALDEEKLKVAGLERSAKDLSVEVSSIRSELESVKALEAKAKGELDLAMNRNSEYLGRARASEEEVVRLKTELEAALKGKEDIISEYESSDQYEEKVLGRAAPYFFNGRRHGYREAYGQGLLPNEPNLLADLLELPQFSVGARAGHSMFPFSAEELEQLEGEDEFDGAPVWVPPPVLEENVDVVLARRAKERSEAAQAANAEEGQEARVEGEATQEVAEPLV